MSIFDERRKQLGAPVAGPTRTTTSSASSNRSAFDRRRQEIEDEREARRQKSIQEADQRRQIKEAADAASRSAFMQAEAGASKRGTKSSGGVTSTQKQWLQEQRAKREQFRADHPGAWAKVDKALEPVSRVIDRAQTLPGIGAFQRGAGNALGVGDVVDRNAPPVTGSPWINKPAELAGGLAGLATVPGPNQVTAPFEAGQAVAGTKGAQALTRLGSRAVQGTSRLGVDEALATAAARGVSRYGGKAIEGGVGGAVGGAAASVASGHSDAREVAQGALFGGALGVAADAGGHGLSDAASKVISKWRGRSAAPAEELLGLPEPQKALPAPRQVNRSAPLELPAPKQRGNANQAATPDVVSPEYQFKLPEGKAGHAENIRAARNDLKDIDREIRQLESDYQRAINEEFQYLKESGGKGKTKGGIVQDAEGNVTGRYGFQSKNPLWYQEFLKANNNKKPNLKELYNLAKKRIDEGFTDEQGTVPPWREHSGYEENMRTLQEVRGQINGSLREMDPAINITDGPIVSKENSFQPKPKRAIPDEPFQAPAPAETPGDRGVINRYVRDAQAGKPIVGRLNEPAVSLSARKVEPEAPAATAAAEEAPAMKDGWFTSLFGNQGLGAAAGRKGRVLTSESQVVDNALKRDTQGTVDEVKAAGRALNSAYVDELAVLKHADPETYEVAHDARRANNLANRTINEEFVTPEGEVIGKGLKQIGNKIARGEGNAFKDYLILRHAETRVGRGEEVYAKRLKLNDVNKIKERKAVLDKRYPKFAAIAEEWDQYNENMRNLWVKEGLITKAQAAAMKEANPHYASMRRQFSLSEKYSNRWGNTQGFSGQKAPIKEVNPNGSTRKIVNPFKSAMEQTGATYQSIMRNRVMQQLYKKIRSNPEEMEGLIEIVPEEHAVRQASLKEFNDLLKSDGLEGALEKLNDEFLGLRKGGQVAGKNDNIVTVLVDGEPIKMKVTNPELFKALVGVGPETSNLVLDFLGALSTATKYGATGALAPLFAAKSLTVDTAQALIQSKNPAAHMWDLMHATISSIANQLPKGTKGLDGLRELARDFERTGGHYSSILKTDRQLNRNASKILREPLLTPKGVGRGVVNTVKTPFKILERVSDVAENVNRIAAYKGELRRQGGQRTAETIRRAMRESQEITTNFSRKGSSSNTLEKFIPYNNAAIQGIRRFGKQLKEHPVQSIAMITGLVIGPKLLEFSKFSDDPDYQKLPARERYRNIFIAKNPDRTFVKIPMPAEYNAIGAFATDLLQAYKGGDPVNWRQSADAIANAYTPPWMSGALQGFTQVGPGGDKPSQSFAGALNATSLSPIAAIVGNQSFTGAPIVPKRLQGASATEQYDEQTTAPAKWIGKQIGMAPKKVDYLIRSYGGDPARLVLPLFSDVGAGTPRNTLLKNFITDPVFTNNLSDDYYNRLSKITQAEANNNLNGTAFPKWYNENTAATATSTAKNTVGGRIKELTASKRDINSNRNLSPKEKAQQLRDVQAQINQLYLEGITLMRNGGVPSGR